MNVFADYVGHSDLYYSLHLLFEKRLGAQLFCPEGLEWYKKGFVKLRPSISIGKIDTIDDVLKNPYCECERLELVDGVYHYHRKMELDKGYYIQKAITFDQFLEMDFDLVVTTFYQHEKTFHDLVRQYKPHTVFIRQIGNIHEKPLGFCKNVLLGQLTPMPPDINYIIYHPEHYEGYRYTPPSNHKTVKNFADDLPSYPVDLDTWIFCESVLKDLSFKMHGRKGRDGSIPHLLMPQAMKDSAFVWHTKGHGGGGFVARQALACGRPCIVRKNYAMWHYELAKDLFMDSVNCVDLDLGVERGIKLIREWAEPERHVEMCKATAEQFKKDVNFAEEAERIKEWIGNLLRR